MTHIGLLFGGVLAGIINALAGGGSTVTLPLLLLFGVDANVANGTNRVAVLCQSLSAGRSFSRQGAINWNATWRLLPFVLGGAIGGAILAAKIDAQQLEFIVGWVFLVLGLFLVFQERLQTLVSSDQLRRFRLPVLILIGFYGGFLQAGVGIPLLLAFLGLYGLSFADANGTKVIHIAIYSVVVLFIFGSENQVHALYGLELGIGGIIGGHIGARIAVRARPRYLRPILALFLLFMGARTLLQ